MENSNLNQTLTWIAQPILGIITLLVAIAFNVFFKNEHTKELPFLGYILQIFGPLFLLFITQRFEQIYEDQMKSRALIWLDIVKVLIYILIFQSVINIFSSGWGWWLLSIFGGILAFILQTLNSLLNKTN